MGRQKDVNKPKAGPGRKSRKQGVPNLSQFEQGNVTKDLSRHQKQRLKKRKTASLVKEELKQNKNKKNIKKDESGDDNSNKYEKKTSHSTPTYTQKLTKDKQSDKTKQKKKFKVPCDDGILRHSDGDESQDDDDLSSALAELGGRPLGEDEMDDASGSEAEEARGRLLPKEAFGDVDEFGADLLSDEAMDDDDEEYQEGVDSDDERPDYPKLVRKMQKQTKRVGEASISEMSRAGRDRLELDVPTLAEARQQLMANPDLQAVSARIADVLFILSNLKERREAGRSRKDYLALLTHDVCAVYSYNQFLIAKLMNVFNPHELLEYLQANDNPRPVTIRTNTLKTRRKLLAQSLISQGVNLDVISWSKVGLVVYASQKVALGATKEYLSGHYMLQGAASFLPVVALAPGLNMRVLDMCAAPGGKSSHLAAMMQNTGVLLCNDRSFDRAKALKANLHRMGVTNAIVSVEDGAKIAELYPYYFDRILVDAPCTGTGVVGKDDSVRAGKDVRDVAVCVAAQKKLLAAAVDAVSGRTHGGSYVVYSTCSVLVEENEMVVDWMLRANKRVKVVPSGVDIGKEGFLTYQHHRFHQSLRHCRRLYPHKNNTDGFFVAKLSVVAPHLLRAAEMEESKAEERAREEEEQMAHFWKKDLDEVQDEQF